MAASPRLTMARRLNGTRGSGHAALCVTDPPRYQGHARVAPPGGPTAPAICRGRPAHRSRGHACCVLWCRGDPRAPVSWSCTATGELPDRRQRPALLLLHGIANSSETWERVAPLLSERFTVIAPDLLGHGESATPRGDYSLGAHASGARDIAHRARPRARHGGRALAGRRHRDAVRLPVPGAHRAPGARLQRRARARGPPAAARRLAAGRRLRPARAHLRGGCVGLGRGLGGLLGARRAARRAATSRCSRAASPRSTTPARARRSCTRCAR